MDIEALRNEWNELNKEYTELEVSFSIMPLSLSATQLLIDLISPSFPPLFPLQTCNRRYIELLEQLYSHQQKCFNEIKHQRYRMNQITASLRQ